MRSSKKQSKSEFVVTVLENPYIPHDPTIKQAEFLVDLRKDGLYGGAAGGGKSDALLMAALQYVSESDYSALLLRRTYADLSLPHALMDRMDEWLRNTDAAWKDKTKTWAFPSGATISFGYLEAEKDKYRYQGAEFQFVGFDELTQFTETQFTYLFSRLRRLEGSEVPVRIRAASNPGGVGHEWVKARYITPSPEELSRDDRFFVPATLTDNPFLDQDAYTESLDYLDPVTKAQLKGGDWDIKAAGNKFREEKFKYVDQAPAGLKLIRFWDMAATEPYPGNKDPDWTVGLLMGEKAGYYYVLDVFRCRKNPKERDEMIARVLWMDGNTIQQRMEQEGGSSGKDDILSFAKTLFKGFDFRGVHPTGSKEVRANGVSGAVDNELVYLVRGQWNSAFVAECCAFPQDGVHDDQVDCFSGAYNELIKYRPRQQVMTWGGVGLSGGGFRV
ncbi:MAG: phage terminase large subunit [Bacteroidales bacterium]|nr:phage terminase large subunit [Bacteroidales bacterium]